jgi:adenosine deaminase CECR1
MPTDTFPKTTSDSQNPIQGFLAKCGITLPTLYASGDSWMLTCANIGRSVRGRRASESNPTRPTMFTANSREKKRKRSTRSLVTASRAQSKMVEPKEPPPEVDWKAVGHEAVFDHFLTSEKHIETYSQNRADLVRTENDISWDSDAKNSASLSEQTAMVFVRELREFERRVVFGNNASEAIPGPLTLDMGGQFLTNKGRIEERSELFKLAKDVPKGAILHLHFNAELNPERLLKEAQSMKNMYVWSIRPLVTKEDLDLTEVIFNVMPATTNSVNIFDSGYKGTGDTWKKPEFQQHVWMRWTDFQKRFSETFPEFKPSDQTDDEAAKERSRTDSEPRVDLNAAENWIKQKMVLSEEEAYRPTQTVNGYAHEFPSRTLTSHTNLVIAVSGPGLTKPPVALKVY